MHTYREAQPFFNRFMNFLKPQSFVVTKTNVLCFLDELTEICLILQSAVVLNSWLSVPLSMRHVQHMHTMAAL